MDAVHHRALRRVAGGDKDPAESRLPRGDRHRQHPPHRTNLPGQGQFPDKGRVVQRLAELSARFQQGEKERQVVYRALLANVGGCKVYRNPADRIGKAAVFHGRPHPVPGLPHRRAGQADHVKAGQALRKIGLHIDAKALHPEQTQTSNPRKHPAAPSFPFLSNKYSPPPLW